MNELYNNTEELLESTFNIIKSQGESKDPLDRVVISSEIATKLNITLRKARSLLANLLKLKKIKRKKIGSQYYYYLKKEG
ncbi:MAG: hypothetical protein ACFFDN_00430 [Candidatus Hodarchaeota archaeon]